MPVFYFPLPDPKIMGVLTSLDEAFGLDIQDAVRVETSIEYLVPLLKQLQTGDDVLMSIEDVAETIVTATKQEIKRIRTRATTGPGNCKRCGKEFEHGTAGYCSKSCYNLAYKQLGKTKLTEIACINCGKTFLPKRKDTKTCSKECYRESMRKPVNKRKPVETPKKHEPIPLPNQAKVNSNLTAEQARIDAVVAKAKLSAPSADFNHHITGPVMGRKI